MPISDPLIELFSRCLKVLPDTLNEMSSPDTVSKWDSLAAMTLVSEIEEKFSVKLTTRDVMRMRTISIAREVLRSKGVSGV